jgi:hypothetical protein
VCCVLERKRIVWQLLDVSLSYVIFNRYPASCVFIRDIVSNGLLGFLTPDGSLSYIMIRSAYPL